MTKKEAAALLGISEKTLQRRVANGVYRCTRTGEGQYAVLSFSHADLGLPEPTPTPVVEAVPEPMPAPLVETVEEPKPEPREPVVIHRYRDGSLVAMSESDSIDQERRDRNAAIVKRRRDQLLTNLRWTILSGTPEAVARQRIDAECNALLKSLNRKPS